MKDSLGKSMRSVRGNDLGLFGLFQSILKNKYLNDVQKKILLMSQMIAGKKFPSTVVEPIIFHP